jgi:hypothetical protein
VSPEAVRTRTRRVAKTPQYPYYRALKKLVVGTRTYKPGQMVPPATGWLRVESWVRSRHLKVISGPEDEAT